MVRHMFASIMGAIGYLLLFAAVAERGQWALRPWDALTEATNTPASSSSSGGSGSGGGGVLGVIKSVGSKLVSPFLPGLP